MSESEDTLRKAIELDPETENWYGLATLDAILGNTEAAIAAIPLGTPLTYGAGEGCRLISMYKLYKSVFNS